MQAQTAPADLYSLLDEWFAGKGFVVEPTGMLFPGRKWSGVVNGRKALVTCSTRTKTRHYGEISRRRYAGHELSGEIETTAATRLTVVRNRSAVVKSLDGVLMAKMGLTVLQEDSEDYPGMRIAAYEEPWASAYLAEDEVKENITSFFKAAIGENPTFSLQPGAASFRMRAPLSDFTPERMGNIMDAMAVLSERVDAQPAPTKQAQLNKFERMAKESPVKLAVMVLGGLTVGVFVLTALMVGLGALMISQPIFLLIIPLLAYGGWRYVRKKVFRRSGNHD